MASLVWLHRAIREVQVWVHNFPRSSENPNNLHTNAVMSWKVTLEGCFGRVVTTTESILGETGRSAVDCIFVKQNWEELSRGEWVAPH